MIAQCKNARRIFLGVTWNFNPKKGMLNLLHAYSVPFLTQLIICMLLCCLQMQVSEFRKVRRCQGQERVKINSLSITWTWSSKWIRGADVCGSFSQKMNAPHPQSSLPCISRMESPTVTCWWKCTLNDCVGIFMGNVPWAFDNIQLMFLCLFITSDFSAKRVNLCIFQL